MFDEKEQLSPWKDPIVAEVRRAREALFAEAGYDLDRLAQRLRRDQAASGRRVVTRPPRRLARACDKSASGRQDKA